MEKTVKQKACNCNCKCESSKGQQKELSVIFEKYTKKGREDLIPLLQDVQQVFGYLSQENLINVANHLGICASKVFGVATFYNQFRLKPLGKYIIRVCRGTACHVKGSAQILETLQSELKIKTGETTEDGLFTLETVACIGACSIAPVIMVNDEFHGRLTSKSVQSVLKKYSK